MRFAGAPLVEVFAAVFKGQVGRRCFFPALVLPDLLLDKEIEPGASLALKPDI